MIIKWDLERARRHAPVFICGVVFQYIYTYKLMYLIFYATFEGALQEISLKMVYVASHIYVF